MAKGRNEPVFRKDRIFLVIAGIGTSSAHTECATMRCSSVVRRTYIFIDLPCRKILPSREQLTTSDGATSVADVLGRLSAPTVVEADHLLRLPSKASPGVGLDRRHPCLTTIVTVLPGSLGRGRDCSSPEVPSYQSSRHDLLPPSRNCAAEEAELATPRGPRSRRIAAVSSTPDPEVRYRHVQAAASFDPAAA